MISYHLGKMNRTKNPADLASEFLRIKFEEARIKDAIRPTSRSDQE